MPNADNESISSFSMRMENQKSPKNNGLSKEDFLKQSRSKLFNFEIKEIENLKQARIYFSGQINTRTEQELKLLRGASE